MHIPLPPPPPPMLIQDACNAPQSAAQKTDPAFQILPIPHDWNGCHCFSAPCSMSANMLASLPCLTPLPPSPRPCHCTGPPPASLAYCRTPSSKSLGSGAACVYPRLPANMHSRFKQFCGHGSSEQRRFSSTKKDASSFVCACACVKLFMYICH